MSFPTAILGRTDVRISALGFGAAAIGNLYRAVSDAAADDTVRAATEVGIGYFDTAPRYGHGLSERRLGAALPGDVAVSSKVGRLLTPIAPPAPGTERHGFVDGDPFEEHFDYSYAGVMRAFEDSLRRLRRDRIDILLAHDLGVMTHGGEHARHLRSFLNGGLQAMQDLKAQGLIGAIGLGVNETAICDEIMVAANIDVILLAGRYTLLEQAPLDGFFERCAAKGVSIIAAAPFNSGLLAGGAHFDYAAPPPDIVARVHRLRAVCERHDVPLAAAALQFPLAHPIVAGVLTGMASADEVRANAALFHHPVPEAVWAELRTSGLLHPDAPLPQADTVLT